ncbi:6-phosphogluconolactonase [Candidatus Uhrbacteria bacterium]|nr:6-phosphogluconolactonase [Candidatus Uhrbacteria bacterium]
MNRIIVAHREKAITRAATALARVLISAHRHPILFLVSGGSAFLLLDHLPLSVFGRALTVGVLDERYSRIRAVNNFLQLKATRFYKRAKSRGVQWIKTVPAKGETLAHFSRRFEGALRAWKKAHPEGRIVATLGMGADGHTVGIMPYPEAPQRFRQLFGNPLQWVVGYDTKKKNPYPLRATTTLSFLQREVDSAVALVCGMEKSDAFGRVNAKRGNLAQTPMRIIHAMKHVQLFTDLLSF